jgi:hypothetical protein
MRRKSRYGVYTNASVKRCSENSCCNGIYCLICKGLCRYNNIPNCKEYFEDHLSYPSPILGRKGNLKRSIHQHGFGKIGSGKTYVYYCSWFHFYKSNWRREGRDNKGSYIMRHSKKQDISDSIQYGIYSYELYKDYKKKRS